MTYTLDAVTSLAMSMEEAFLGPVPGVMSRLSDQDASG